MSKLQSSGSEKEGSRIKLGLDEIVDKGDGLVVFTGTKRDVTRQGVDGRPILS